MSSWKELPNWKAVEEYDFLKDQTPRFWAWEFLRRNPEYRADWARLLEQKALHGEHWVKQPDSYSYFPEKLPQETDKHWRHRVVSDASGEFGDVIPVCVRLDVALGSNWSLVKLFDPSLPYSQGVEFIRPGSNFPCLLNFINDFDALVHEHDTATGGSVEAVSNNLAVIAFDINQALEHQLRVAEQLLRQRKKMMQEANKLLVQSHSNKIAFWKRHIRALDARRSVPPATYTDIAKELAMKTLEDSFQSPDKVGHKCYQQGLKMSISGYRQALLIGQKTIPGH